MLDNYKKEYKAIEVPAHLKAETILKMEAEKRKRKLVFITKMVTASLGVCFIIISTLFYTRSDKNTIFIKGETMEEVYVNNQKMIFDNIDDDLKLAGDGLLNRRMVTKEKALEIWGNSLPTMDLNEFSDVTTTYYGYYKDITLTDIEIVTTFTIDGKKMQIIFNNDDREIKSNSTLDNKEVYLSYKNKDEKTIYTMVYTLQGIEYSIVSEELEQEEFIKNSSTILKKIK